MAFDPKVNRNEKDAIGDPGDAIATNTTEPWTSISLLKGIFGKVGGGGTTVVASDVAQDSTTAGQSGGLQQGAVTTAAPSYTTGKTNPLSLKTNGDLRVSDADGNALLTTIDSKLGDLKTYTDGLETLATTLNTYVDGLETLIGTTNTALTTLQTYTDSLEGYTGALTEAAPATDTASSGLNGRLQRVSQRLTSLIALLPAALGSTTSANSLAVTLSSDGPFSTLTGAATETAPATDTASSGVNGRLQRIAQRLTSLIALVPASLGAKTAAASFAVTLATDDAAVTTLGATGDAAVTAGATGSISAKLRSISRDILTNIVLAAGSNLIGRIVADASAATGGISSTSRILSAAASTNGTSAKASAGRVYAVQGYNAATAVRYLKLYNKASAPTVGTDTPVKTLALPPSAAFAFDWPHGYSLATGIAYALTTGSADADTGALTAADVLGLNVDYS